MQSTIAHSLQSVFMLTGTRLPTHMLLVTCSDGEVAVNMDALLTVSTPALSMHCENGQVVVDVSCEGFEVNNHSSASLHRNAFADVPMIAGVEALALSRSARRHLL